MLNMRGLPGRLTWLVAAFVAIVASFIAIQPAGAAEQECNGAAELCAKPFNEVVLPGTHNSMSTLDQGWLIPNQLVSIPKQLDAGIRAMLIDTHYGKANSQGKVTNVDTEHKDDPGVEMYLCHERCDAGASELIPELVKVRNFLTANPGEALVFVNQASVTPEDFEEAVIASGLNNFLYTGSTTDGEWPTLGEMITGNHRVVMFSEGNTGSVEWYHDAYAGSLQETPYNFHESGDTTIRQAIDRITKPENLNESCRPSRGGDVGSLFLMNHWVNGKLDDGDKPLWFTPDPAVAKIVNTRAALVARARACQERRGIMPTIIAVDDFGEGDLINAVRILNGLQPLPDPVPDPDPIPDPPAIPQIKLKVGKAKNAVVRAGRRAVIKVPVSNIGDGPGTVKVCAKVPGRLAKKPKCAFADLTVGGSARPAVKIQTKRRAKGSGKVVLTVTTANERFTAKTTLKVKPAKKKSKKRR